MAQCQRDGEQNRKARCVAQQHHAQGCAQGAAGPLHAHAAGKISAAPEQRRGERHQDISLQDQVHRAVLSYGAGEGVAGLEAGRGARFCLAVG